MVYELALAMKSGFGDEDVTKTQEMVISIVQAHEGDVLISDDWGHLSLPQETNRGTNSIRMLYFIYSANNENNRELVRRLRIAEGVVRHMIALLGDESNAGTIVKNLKTPFSKKYPGSVTDGEEGGGEEDKKKLARRKNCYFTARNIRADWKDPKTYVWLVNEFGKISPARVSNVSRKHQRFVTTAIKRARNIGFIAHTSNQVARINN